MLGISSGSVQSIMKDKWKAEFRGSVSTPEYHACSYWFVSAWISMGEGTKWLSFQMFPTDHVLCCGEFSFSQNSRWH